MRLTMLWIVAGGLSQAAFIIFLLIRGDSNLRLLTKPFRFLLLLMAPTLMGPVIVNLYSAIYVFRHSQNGNIKEDIVK